MDFIAEHPLEILVGVIFFVGFIMLALSKMGMLELGEQKCPLGMEQKPFPECETKMKEAVSPLEKKIIDTIARLIRLEEGQIFVKERLDIKGKKIDKITEDVSYIRGYIEKNGLNKE